MRHWEVGMERAMAANTPPKGIYTRVVVGLTTIPSRVRHLAPVIAALYDQTRRPDAIYVSVPRVSAKEKGVVYPVEELSRILAKHAGDRGRVLVVPEDFGPLTKLMGMLLSEADDPRTLLITADDDQLYGPNFVETMLRGAQENPGAAVCLCGHTLGRGPFVWGFRCSRSDDNPISRAVFLRPGTKVTVVSGWCGCGYPRSVFGPAGSLPDPHMELLRKREIPLLNRHDDLYISSWLYRLRVPKVLIAYRGRHHDEELPHAQENALSSGDSSRSPRTMVKHLAEWWRFANQLRRMGLLEPSDDVPWNKSTVFMAAVCCSVLAIGAIAGIGAVIYVISRRGVGARSRSRLQTLALTAKK